MQERRTANRIRTNIQARWESLTTQGRGSVCDLSSSGGFVLTGGTVAPRELLRLQLLVGDDMVTAWGYVVYQISDMGFAVRFVFQDESDKRPLADVVERAQSKHA